MKRRRADRSWLVRLWRWLDTDLLAGYNRIQEDLGGARDRP